MKLFHNADLVNLKSIMEKGIVSMDECGINTWDDGRRSPNATNVVYLHSPKTELNTFTMYGVALIEVEVENATKSTLHECDRNEKNYDEYTVEKVPVDCIKTIYIPEIFKEIAEQYITPDMPVVWCGIEAKSYFNDTGRHFVNLDDYTYRPCTEKDFNQFVKTASIADTGVFNFFRGVFENNEIYDIYEVKYLI